MQKSSTSFARYDLSNRPIPDNTVLSFHSVLNHHYHYHRQRSATPKPPRIATCLIIIIIIIITHTHTHKKVITTIFQQTMRNSSIFWLGLLFPPLVSFRRRFDFFPSQPCVQNPGKSPLLILGTWPAQASSSLRCGSSMSSTMAHRRRQSLLCVCVWGWYQAGRTRRPLTPSPSFASPNEEPTKKEEKEN